MDTSKQYIKMCEKAEEIQKILDGDFGDDDDRVVAYKPTPHRPQGGGWLVKFSWPYECPLDEYFVYLPRQDQLQEMVHIDGVCDGVQFMARLDRFDCFVWPEEMGDSVNLNYVASMEQLWLAFVMKELYRKAWSGEEWLTSK